MLPRLDSDFAGLDDLTPREMQLIRHAAKLAVREVTEQFYSNVGKWTVRKLLIILGGTVVGFCVAKGWIRF